MNKKISLHNKYFLSEYSFKNDMASFTFYVYEINDDESEISLLITDYKDCITQKIPLLKDKNNEPFFSVGSINFYLKNFRLGGIQQWKI